MIQSVQQQQQQLQKIITFKEYPIHKQMCITIINVHNSITNTSEKVQCVHMHVCTCMCACTQAHTHTANFKTQEVKFLAKLKRIQQPIRIRNCYPETLKYISMHYLINLYQVFHQEETEHKSSLRTMYVTCT